MRIISQDNFNRSAELSVKASKIVDLANQSNLDVGLQEKKKKEGDDTPIDPNGGEFKDDCWKGMKNAMVGDGKVAVESKEDKKTFGFSEFLKKAWPADEKTGIKKTPEHGATCKPSADTKKLENPVTTSKSIGKGSATDQWTKTEAKKPEEVKKDAKQNGNLEHLMKPPMTKDSKPAVSIEGFKDSFGQVKSSKDSTTSPVYAVKPKEISKKIGEKLEEAVKKTKEGSEMSKGTAAQFSSPTNPPVIGKIVLSESAKPLEPSNQLRNSTKDAGISNPPKIESPIQTKTTAESKKMTQESKDLPTAIKTEKSVPLGEPKKKPS